MRRLLEESKRNKSSKKVGIKNCMKIESEVYKDQMCFNCFFLREPNCVWISNKINYPTPTTKCFCFLLQIGYDGGTYTLYI